MEYFEHNIGTYISNVKELLVIFQACRNQTNKYVVNKEKYNNFQYMITNKEKVFLKRFNDFMLMYNDFKETVTKYSTENPKCSNVITFNKNKYDNLEQSLQKEKEYTENTKIKIYELFWHLLIDE